MSGTDYGAFRDGTVKAGGFTVWTATHDESAAALHDRLSRDPEIACVPKQFPWTEVRWRDPARQMAAMTAPDAVAAPHVSQSGNGTQAADNQP